MVDATLPSEDVVFVFGPFTLDPRTRRLSRGGSTVPLTTKAFDTLEALVQSAGRTVAKDSLLKQIWRDTFVQEDTLAQNISTIRRVLGDSADSPRYVLTVPREGYRFVAPVDMVRAQSLVDSERSAGKSATLPQPPKTLRSRPWLLYYALGIASGLLLVPLSALWGFHRASSSDGVAKPPTFEVFEVFEPDGTHFSSAGGALAVSPDGRYLAFVATDAAGRDQIWLRSLDSRESVAVPGTEDSSQPFWSADSRSIAFAAGGFLRRITVPGGEPRTICKLPGPVALAGSWSRHDLILFAVSGKGIFQVAASGGTAIRVNIPQMDTCLNCLWPSFLPDGRRFLFTIASVASDRGIYTASLDGALPVRLVDSVSSSAYSDNGYLLYASSGALVAQRFDPSAARVIGNPVPIAERVWTNPGTGRAVFGVSRTGFLAYREPQLTQLQWVARNGSVVSTSRAAIYYSFTVSRDGRVLAAELDPSLGTYDLWVHDARWAQHTRLTFNPASELNPLWSNDGSAAVFAREEHGGWQLYAVDVDRPGVEHALLPRVSTNPVKGLSWNGDVLEYVTFGRLEPARMWKVRPGHDEPAPLPFDAGAVAEMQLSPDMTRIAYTMSVTDSRVPEMRLLLRPWPTGSGQTQIAEAASVPRWRGDGAELFFITPAGQLMAQRIDAGRTVGAAVRLFGIDVLPASGLAGQAYDAAPDGQHFLVKLPAHRPSIVAMSGWPARIER